MLSAGIDSLLPFGHFHGLLIDTRPSKSGDAQSFF